MPLVVVCCGVRLIVPAAESVIPAPVMTHAALAPVIEYIAGRVRRTSKRSHQLGTFSRCRVCRSAVTHTARVRLPGSLDVRGTGLFFSFFLKTAPALVFVS